MASIRRRSLSQATISAYREIFEVLETTEHRHLIRVWNYLPGDQSRGGRRRALPPFQFSARQTAFRSVGRPTEVSVPAACALGSPAGSPISIYFLAAREPPTMIENPRQTSAYRYPPKFGVHSPSFSRACVLQRVGRHQLFVSGTASIVGYETMHHGDVVRADARDARQPRCVAGARPIAWSAASRYSLDGLKFKVYVRRPRDLDAIKSALAASLGPRRPSSTCRRTSAAKSSWWKSRPRARRCRASHLSYQGPSAARRSHEARQALAPAILIRSGERTVPPIHRAPLRTEKVHVSRVRTKATPARPGSSCRPARP